MTFPEAFALLGLEEATAYAARIVLTPEHRRMVEMCLPEERMARRDNRTGRTTRMLVHAAVSAVSGAEVFVWVMPGHREMIREKIGGMIRKLGGDPQRVTVVSRPYKSSRIAGINRKIALYHDHTISGDWPREILAEVDLRNAILGARP